MAEGYPPTPPPSGVRPKKKTGWESFGILWGAHKALGATSAEGDGGCEAGEGEEEGDGLGDGGVRDPQVLTTSLPVP